MDQAATLQLGVLVTQLGGGLALFLYGMRQMTESLKTVADEPQRMQTFQIETDIIESYRRLHTYIRRIARLSMDVATAGAKSDDERREADRPAG